MKVCYVFAACVVASVFFASSVPEVECKSVAESPKKQVEDRNPLAIIVGKIIAHLFKRAAKHCLKEAKNECKQHAKNRKAALKCAKNFLKRNKGRCAIKG